MQGKATRRLVHCAVALTACVHASAQDFTSPQGHLNTAGNSYDIKLLGYFNGSFHRHVTQIDDSLRGTPRPGLHTISYRRSTRIGNWTAPARTTEVEIRMAHGDYGRVRHAGTNTISDLQAGAWTTVFTSKTVNLPDWSNRPAGSVAPWDVHLLLDVTFDYNGTDALLWQTRSHDNSLGVSRGYPGDMIRSTISGTVAETTSGQGCMATGQVSSMRTYSYLNTYGTGAPTSWQFTTLRAPALTNVWMIIGLANPGFDFGGCERLHATPHAIVPMRALGSSGYASLNLSIEHDPAYVGLRLHAQSFAIDRTQSPPLALSNGTTSTYAAPPQFSIGVASGEDIGFSSSWPTTTRLYKDRGVITGFSN